MKRVRKTSVCKGTAGRNRKALYMIYTDSARTEKVRTFLFLRQKNPPLCDIINKIAAVIFISALGIIELPLANGGVMKPTYVLKRTDLRFENGGKGSPEFVIKEGDIILDKLYQLEVLPAAMDFTKPVTRKKVPDTPLKPSERLLRIKELGEASAVVAVLQQETYYEGADTLVTKETEKLITVKYGENFSVYAKKQVYDSSGAVTYDFIITDKSKPQEQKAQNFCTECGAKLIKGDKFCRECGTPVLKAARPVN